jgi:plastocyanin
MINKSIFGFAVIAALGFGLVGCGDSNNSQEEVLDEIFGGSTVNGCDPDAYQDLRGSTSVTITSDSAWVDPHSACIIVTAGTPVTWQGNFDTHPLVGGVTATRDSGSPITEAMASGTDDVTVTFNPTQGQAFPYFCTQHPATMLGVIVVVPST